ncbi:hypothetical protein Cgig2_001300 [Carnegiea gigantea]|uniref:Uncharacterized protein n=1 Tax=Carnegiea gigantea TaxID=171969 RepID=A0A9Q1JTS7_9CARY|nr:hypothetical protein Cgig2_001300 [Carnegiea gigantea]
MVVYLEHHYLLPYCILLSQFKILLQQLGFNQSKLYYPLGWVDKYFGRKLLFKHQPSTQPTSSLRASDSVVQQQPAHPSSSTARAQPAIRLDLKTPTQPSPSMTPTEPLVQKPPDLVLAAQVQQPNRPITSPASEQASKRPSIKHAEPILASVPTIKQPHVRCPTSSGAPRPPIQPLHPLLHLLKL